MNINELREKVKNGDFDDNELIDLVLYLERENQALLEETKKYKEVIDKAKTELEQGITFCQNDSQGLYDKCNIAINREQRILDILKEVE